MGEHAEVNIAAYDKYIRSVDWLQEAGLPVAITLTEVLESCEGKDAVIFPPTFAMDKKALYPYQIDEFRTDIPPQAAKPGEEVNTCLIDSIGSQANRMEPGFKQAPLSGLVPQVEVRLKNKAADEETSKPVNLLDIGHRIADGAIRFSGLHDKVREAIMAMRDKADAGPLAKLAPTSLLFGFWDSRPGTTMFKWGRMLRSEIRATNVVYVKRSAQFNPAFDPSLIGLADEVPDDAQQPQSGDEAPGKAGDGKDPLSKLGLRAAPAVGTHGGIRVYGQIVRRTQINLVTLRSLGVTNGTNGGGDLAIDGDETLKLRRYILGLALVAARSQANYALREGCLLVCTGEPKAGLVYSNSKSEDFDWDLRQCFFYAQEAAKEFGIESSQVQTYEFDGKEAKEGVERLKGGKAKGKKSK